MAYLALEPAVRRRWPWRLTAWKRLLHGRWRDPLVGRDLLIGSAAGVGCVLLWWLTFEGLGPWLGLPVPPPSGIILEQNTSLSPLAIVVNRLAYAVTIPLFLLTLAFLLFLLLRKPWLYWTAFVLLNAWMNVLFKPTPNLASAALLAIYWVPVMAISATVLGRFGLLASAALNGCFFLLGSIPLTTHLSAWYANQGLVGGLVILGLACCACFTALGGRKVLRERFFAED